MLEFGKEVLLIKDYTFMDYFISLQNSLALKLTAIRDASRALVSGGGDSRILLEQLVCKLTSR